MQQALDLGAKYVDSEYATVALVGMAMAKLKMNDRAAAVENFRRAADKAQNSPALAARYQWNTNDSCPCIFFPASFQKAVSGKEAATGVIWFSCKHCNLVPPLNQARDQIINSE